MALLRALLPVAMVGAGLLTIGLVMAQSPTITPTLAASATASAMATVEPSRTPPPTFTPTPELEFNFDEVKEVVVPLIGDDGRTHYVTLSEDTAGVVRVGLSLLQFPAGYYAVALSRDGHCPSLGYVFEHWEITQPEGGASTLVMHFHNTTQISLMPGDERSISDFDGTSLSVVSGKGRSPGSQSWCAVLAGPPGAPGVGTGVNSDGEKLTGATPWAAIGIVVLAVGAGAFWAMSRRPEAA